MSSIDLESPGGDRAGLRAALRDVVEVYPDAATLLASTKVDVTEGDRWLALGEGVVYEVAATDATDHHRVTAGGTKLYVMPQGGAVPISAFAPPADWTEDAAPAIQAAVHAVAYLGRGNEPIPARVLLDRSRLTIDETIHVGYGTPFDGGSSFKGVTVEGAMLAYGGNGNVHAGVGIWSTMLDRPAVVVQGGRFTRVRGLALRCAAVRDAIFNHGGAGQPLVTTRMIRDEAEWDAALTAGGVTPGRQYAPHVGIAVDAYDARPPGGHVSYPDVDYPAFLGAVDQYNDGGTQKSASSQTEIEAYIAGYEVAFVNKPANAFQNADFTKIRGTAEWCKYALAIGNSQSRNFDCSGFVVAFCWTAVTNRTFGQIQGTLAANIANMHIAGGVYQIFDLILSWASPLTFDSMYCEALVKIGNFTSDFSGAMLVFDGCYFNFKDFSDETNVGYHLTGNGPGRVVFRNSQFRVPRVLALQPENVDLDGSRIQLDYPPQKAYEALCLNALAGGYAQWFMTARPQKVMANVYDATDASMDAHALTDETFKYTSRNYCIPHFVTEASCETLGSWRGKRMYSINIGPGNRTIVSRVQRAVTFTSSLVTNGENDWVRNLLPGCVIMDQVSGLVMFIRSVDRPNDTVIAEVQNNYYLDENDDYQLLDDHDLTTGTWTVVSGLVYAPKRMLWGDLTAGSNVITNVRSAGGINETNYGLTVGDLLAAEYYEDIPISGSSGRAITAIDTSAGTITLQGNVNFSATHFPLPWWYRQPPANEASR